jgi:hypothetical protein
MDTKRPVTWEKVTNAGDPALYYTRKSTEQLLYTTRGRGLRRIDRGVPQCIRAPRQEHSRKPNEAYDGLGRLFGPVRRLELFARTICIGAERLLKERTVGESAVVRLLRARAWADAHPQEISCLVERLLMEEAAGERRWI